MLLKTRTITSTQETNYVDLGLPSGLLWSTCNIGADEPTDYGDYFMWGNAEPDTNYYCNWAHAPFNTGYASYNAKYFKSIQDKVCPNGILASEYDAATTILGDYWRLPTYNDFNELLHNTTNIWVINYQNSNINGRLFTAKTDDSKTLFIPASGYRSGSSFYDRGSFAHLWSSLIDANSPNFARDFYFDDSNCSMCNNSSYYGFCLRGVKEI